MHGANKTQFNISITCTGWSIVFGSVDPFTAGPDGGHASVNPLGQQGLATNYDAKVSNDCNQFEIPNLQMKLQRFGGLLTGLFSTEANETYILAQNGTSVTVRIARADCNSDIWRGSVGPGAGQVSLMLSDKSNLTGTVDVDGSMVTWSNGSKWRRKEHQYLPPLVPTNVSPQDGKGNWSAPNEKIKRVTVVFMTHLDIGYVDTMPNVVNRYFDTQFRDAITTSKYFREEGGEINYVWTTHAWLISMYLDCPTGLGFHCPNATELLWFKDALSRGELTWHAGIHNMQPEYMSEQLFRDSVQIVHDLDDAFHRPRKITLSQRDVPGMTRGVVPLLKSKGCKAITVGVDGENPNVPPIFRWRDVDTNTEIIGMSGPSYAPPPIAIDGFDHALMFSVRSDNSGPQPADEVRQAFAEARYLFPNAVTTAGAYDDFVNDVVGNKTVHENLEVITSEIGE
jgi:hypothetical protein